MQGCTLKRIMLCQIKFGLLFKISNYHSKLLRVHVSSVYIWQYIFTAFSTARVHFKRHSTKSNLSTFVDMHIDPNECKVMFYHRVQGLYGCSNIISIYYQIFSSKHSSSYALIRWTTEGRCSKSSVYMKVNTTPSCFRKRPFLISAPISLFKYGIHVRFPPVDLFSKILHTPESIYAFVLKQLRSLEATAGNEIS